MGASSSLSPVPGTDRPPATVVAVEMGYGHLRAAVPLADALATPLLPMDRAPLAGPEDEAAWRRTRKAYEAVSRLSQLPFVGRPMAAVLDAITAIPRLHPYRDLSAPTAAVRTLERMFERGLADRLLAHLRRRGDCLVTTFFAPAIFADLGGWDRIVCVVTDADVNRVWVPREARRTRITYCVPTDRARRRLLAYGVPSQRIHLTGFPLPLELVDGTGRPPLEALVGRLRRLDPAGLFRDQHGLELDRVGVPSIAPLAGDDPPTLTFAVGGAGAQAEMARPILLSLAPLLHEGRVRLVLVAGTRQELAERFAAWCAAAGLSELLDRAVEILWKPDFLAYYRAFNDLLARTDVLWTKPSELSFYGALGVPLLLAPPVGAHERRNRRWAIQRGGALDQGDPRWVGQWLPELLADGTLAAAAWAGYVRMPAFGTRRIVDVVRATFRDATPAGRRGALTGWRPGPAG